jgi:hypothetical protein
LALVLSLPTAGCGSGDEGPTRVSVSGTVLLDGVPLASGMIRFIPTDSNTGPAAAAVIRNGAYELDESEGPVIGRHRVEIEASGYLAFAVDDEQSYAAFVQSDAVRQPRMLENPVPETYNRRSTLSVAIQPDEANQHDFELASTPAQPAQTAQR